ncbi:SAM-dependent methyltransferase [Enterococcus florum]|uniref:SAM-dependent methyltransferase n=1 Tax=Enterococcus florum TaxID=2480627 RepID=A0A4P5P8Y6_9ENTE|nr:tRNA (adenine(22)-N(1))-methyltransferase TrmK [Enterococcus florum]GCF94525.1 SAM-dependent methyltransferase [Enterococcus florum]
MKANELSKRLQVVADFVPANARLADIGSDHAYLPVALMLQDRIQYAVAGEVVAGPYESAKRQTTSNGLEERIDVRLADGLEAIRPSDEINVVTICGMGGVLIRDILQKGKERNRLSGKERLILQPNVGEKHLRIWLMQEGYQILNETILEENKKIYEVIVAEKRTEAFTYTSQELLFGPILMREKNSVFLKKWRRQLEKHQSVLNDLTQSSREVTDKIHEFQQEAEWIKEVLADGSTEIYRTL